MVRRTTVLIEDEVYNALVKESLEEYKSAKAISKVLNEILKKSLSNKERMIKLIHSKKLTSTTAAEFEKFRGGLSKGL